MLYFDSSSINRVLSDRLLRSNNYCFAKPSALPFDPVCHNWLPRYNHGYAWDTFNWYLLQYWGLIELFHYCIVPAVRILTPLYCCWNHCFYLSNLWQKRAFPELCKDVISMHRAVFRLTQIACRPEEWTQGATKKCSIIRRSQFKQTQKMLEIYSGNAMAAGK